MSDRGTLEVIVTTANERTTDTTALGEMKNLITAILMTIVTTVLLGLIYPLVVTGWRRSSFPIKRMDH